MSNDKYLDSYGRIILDVISHTAVYCLQAAEADGRTVITTECQQPGYHITSVHIPARTTSIPPRSADEQWGEGSWGFDW